MLGTFVLLVESNRAALSLSAQKKEFPRENPMRRNTAPDLSTHPACRVRAHLHRVAPYDNFFLRSRKENEFTACINFQNPSIRASLLDFALRLIMAFLRNVSYAILVLLNLFQQSSSVPVVPILPSSNAIPSVHPSDAVTALLPTDPALPDHSYATLSFQHPC